ncbi:hypothetical protein LOTGIDRAFT_175929 [Lottia gigantea]|uniref:Uncharacterized protein n=1 Tax=Lottia gigantea TaxID=225164 RepID=V3ZZ66_LOTGI|nr:hypothetical protein LOTGIDRAFT_175929 [Lottia gigantea]ESO87925.1 hypothetical protein LOTGIDRAFT_175929 [Lottia gigantea]
MESTCIKIDLFELEYLCFATQHRMEHVCEQKGCKEGYVSIDGNEKLRRPMCKAPKVNVHLKFGMPRIVQCCPNSPLFGGSNQVPIQCSYCNHSVRKSFSTLLDYKGVIRMGVIRIM